MVHKKILRLEGSVLDFINSEIDKGEIGDKRLSKKLKENFSISISYETLRLYRLERNKPVMESQKQTEPMQYYVIKKSRKKNIGDRRDYAILAALSGR